MDTCHQAFFQWMLTERVVSDDNIKCAIQALISKECSQQEMFDFILPVQKALRPFELDMIRIFYHSSGEFLWGVVNVNGDEIAKLATCRTADEVVLYKRILKHLSDAPNHSASQIDLAVLLQKSGAVNLTASKAENLIQTFVDDFWLHKTNSGKLVVGPKAVLELKKYLTEEKLFRECSFCKNLIVSGTTVKCNDNTTGKCSTFLHKHCTETMQSCPTCKVAFGKAPGEEVAEEVSAGEE